MATLKENVQRMIDAGVPEEEIGNFIKKHSPAPTQADQFVEGAAESPFWRSAAQGVASIPGAVVGSALGPVGAVGGAALTGAIGGQIYDLATGWGSESTPDPTLGGQAFRAVEDVAYDVGVPAAASKVLPAVAKAGRGLFAPNKTRLLRGGTMEDVSALREAQQMGFEPNVGWIDSENAREAAQALGRSIGGSQNMAKNVNYNADKWAELFQEQINKIGRPLSIPEAGDIIKSEVMATNKAAKKFSDDMFSAAFEGVKADDMVRADNVLNAMNKYVDEALISPAAANELKAIEPEFQNIMNELTKEGTLSKTTLDVIKRNADAAYGKANPTKADALFKGLKKAAQQDLESHVLEFGGPTQKKILQDAKQFYTWYKQGPESARYNLSGGKVKAPSLEMDALDLAKKTEQGQALQWLTSDAFKEYGGAIKLKRVMDYMPEAAQNDVRASIIRKLATPTTVAETRAGDALGMTPYGPQNISMNAFAKNLKGMPSDVKKAVFGKSLPAYEKLGRVADRMRGLESSKNFSGTAKAQVRDTLLQPVIYATLGGGFGGLGTALKGAAAGTAVVGGKIALEARASRLATNPKFINWLADTAQVVTMKPTGAPAQYARLAALAREEPNLKEPIQEYMQSLGLDTKTVTDKNGKVKTMEVR